MKKLRGILVLAAAGILTGNAVQSWAASSALLSTLDTGVGSISAGNATYSDFSYGGTTLDSTVVATASVDGSGNAVITFTRTSGDWTEADGNSVISFHADFTVPVVSTQLDFDATATGLAMSTVGETLNDGSPHPLQVFTGFLGSQLTDSYTFGVPVTSIDTLKSIDVSAGGGAPEGDFDSPSVGDSGTITSVDNVFVSTPEPASLGVLGMGVVGLLLRRRSR